MVFDLRTSEAARDFVLEFLGITKTDLAMTFALECEGDVDTLIDVLWKKYFDMIDVIDINNLKIMAFHITASLDNCAEVRENGLINLQKVLSEDTILRRILNKYGTIKTDEAGTLDFSGVPAFLVTNAFIVQRSAAKMFNIVSGPQLLSIHQGFCDYRPGFQCPWTHGP